MFQSNVDSTRTGAQNSLDWIKKNVAGAANLNFGDDPAKWGDVLKNAGITLGPDAQASFNKAVGAYAAAKASMDEGLGSLEAMKKLLQSGDIEGAVMLLQTTRAKGLEQQLGGRIGALQSRNAEIKARSDLMAEAQKHQFDKVNGKDPDDTEKGRRAGEISTMKNAIDQLNSDSQLDMIGIQGLVNKRNEAFDTLTNLLGKFQKTIDGIVSNMR
jgi:hypothetical protein